MGRRPLHLEAAHPIKLHELRRALENQPRALDALDARYEPLDVVIIEEQRPDERVARSSAAATSSLRLCTSLSEKTVTLTSSLTDWAHFSYSAQLKLSKPLMRTISRAPAAVSVGAAR